MPSGHELLSEAVAGDLFGVFYLAGSVGVAYLILAAGVVLWRSRARTDGPPLSDRFRTVTILKPLHGAEPDLKRRLDALYKQDYRGKTQIVFGCHDHKDQAIDAVSSLMEQTNEGTVLVVDARTHGTNCKVSNLINMFSQAEGELLVVSDSDIEVGSDYLSRVLTPLEDETVGALTCLYHGVSTGSIASIFSALMINAHFLPSVVFAVALGLANPCFGSTIAMRRDVLERIGGFRDFADKLADDYAIGQAVREAGFRVVIPSFTLGHVCHERTIAEFVRHQLRFNRTVRTIDPLGYAGAAFGNPVPFALVCLANGSSQAFFLLCAALLARIALTKATERAFCLPRQPLWLLPATDVLLFAVYVWSYFGTSVTWKGRRYMVVSDGTLSQDRSTPAL